MILTCNIYAYIIVSGKDALTVLYHELLSIKYKHFVTKEKLVNTNNM